MGKHVCPEREATLPVGQAVEVSGKLTGFEGLIVFPSGQATGIKGKVCGMSG